MDSALILKIKFYMRTIQYRIGYLSVFGLTFLATAIIVYLNFNLEQSRRLSSLQNAYNKVLTKTPATLKQSTLLPTYSVESFFMQFPTATQKEDALKTIIKLAGNNSLPLVAGKYETLFKESDQLVFYQISLPLKGKYPQIKQFLAATLTTLPNASLSQLFLHQISAESDQIEANVVFTLYFSKTV